MDKCDTQDGIFGELIVFGGGKIFYELNIPPSLVPRLKLIGNGKRPDADLADLSVFRTNLKTFMYHLKELNLDWRFYEYRTREADWTRLKGQSTAPTLPLENHA